MEKSLTLMEIGYLQHLGRLFLSFSLLNGTKLERYENCYLPEKFDWRLLIIIMTKWIDIKKCLREFWTHLMHVSYSNLCNH